MSTTVGELLVKIGLDSDALKRGMSQSYQDIKNFGKNTESNLSGVSSKISTGLKLVGAAAAAGFGAAVTGAVKGASSLESYRNTLNVVMGDQKKAAETMAWAVDFANKTPFETDSVVEATVRLSAYGLKAQEVLPSIGNMASVMNKDIMQAVEAVADAQTGELERLKEFGITKKMIVEQGNKVMRGVELVNKQGQIVDQQNFNKALFSLMNERFKGGMEIQATSFKGLWSTVAGTFSTTLATMAGISATGEVKIGGLFDSLKKKMQAVIDKLNEWQKNGTLDKWASATSDALSAFFNVASTVLGYLVDVGKFIYDNWSIISPILAGVLAGFLAFKTITTVIAVINGIKTAWAALNLVMLANPIVLVCVAIGLLIAAGVALYQNWDTVKKYLSAAWESIKSGAEKIWTNLKNFFKKWGDDLLLLVMGPAGWAVLLAKKLGISWEDIKKTADNIWVGIKNGISNAWRDINSGVATAVGNLYNTVKSKLESTWSYIKSLPSQAYGWGKDIIQRFIDGFKSLKIPTPHISKTGSYSVGVGDMSVSIPTFGVNWYDKGGIFKSPSIIGVGEKRPEFVGALDDLRDIFRSELSESGSGDLIVNMNGPVTVRDDNDILRIAKALYAMYKQEARSLGVSAV